MRALAFDRQSIEKKDFPIARRGYDPTAVDEHLASLAGEVELLEAELDRARRDAASPAPAAPAPVAPAAPAPRGVQSLALAASEQVRLIVDAAESSAADIERSAQEEAARIRAEADEDARRVREEAIARSQDHVGQVGDATSTMLGRVDAMESELGALLESLRTGSNRLTADLTLLQGNLGELYGPAEELGGEPPIAPLADPPIAVAPPPPPPPAPLPPEPELEPIGFDDSPGLPDALAERVSAPAPLSIPEPVAPPPPAPEPEPAPSELDFGTAEPAPPAVQPPRADDGDVEGARLIALNMALNGQSREETDAYLRDNFDLGDRQGLLDEVYATVEG